MTHAGSRRSAIWHRMILANFIIGLYVAIFVTIIAIDAFVR